jgi:hypothetical protein
MTKPGSSLYLINHGDIGARLGSHLDRGCRRAAQRPLVFFRADDIGVPSRSFAQLITCFQKHRLPLCLATVPAWLTAARLHELRRLTGTGSAQWCWHQHGWVHRNFESSGKKQEFGPARTKSALSASLRQGKERLTKLLDTDFHPVFTPPWNRCGSDTLQALVDLHFTAVSRSKGARPETLAALPEYQVNVDLHTRKESIPELALENLLRELEQAIASGLCGIMLHHQKMNRAALLVLDILLGLIAGNKKLLPVHFGDLATDRQAQPNKSSIA